MSFDATEIQNFRAAVKANSEAMGLANITLNDVVTYAAAKTLKDFPELKIIMSHGGYPFVHEAIYACYRNKNVYMDISEYEAAPMCETYFNAMKSMIADKVLFASAHPFVDQRDCLATYQAAGLSPEVSEKIMYKNACKVLGLDCGCSAPASSSVVDQLRGVSEDRLRSLVASILQSSLK